jgi:hypothetical protein
LKLDTASTFPEMIPLHVDPMKAPKAAWDPSVKRNNGKKHHPTEETTIHLSLEACKCI